jgi:hypothetical protein
VWRSIILARYAFGGFAEVVPHECDARDEADGNARLRARVHPDGGEEIGVCGADNRGYATAGGQPGDVDAPAVASMPVRKIPCRARDDRRSPAPRLWSDGRNHFHYCATLFSVASAG